MIRRAVSSFIAASLFAAAAAGHAAPPPGAVGTGAESGTVAPLVDRVKGAVVTIQSTKYIRRFAVEDPWTRMMREQFGMAAPRAQREKQEALGSGFIVDKSGIILTNNHVVAGADEVIVRLPDNRHFQARVLGSDPPTDVAVVRIDKPPGDLQTVTLGDSDRVRVGDYVLAIGNPLGLGQTVTMGIVSAKNRVIGEKLGDIDPRYEDFIQTDAAINQGNSGGPLFNFRGEVIGVNAAIINPGVAMNVGFAIPINIARQVADQIRKSGRVARGFLGVSGEDFTAERAAEMRVPFLPGALINAVGHGTPAAAAGLRSNDVVTECAGKPIDGYRRLVATIALLRPGEKAKLVLHRQGQRVETTVTLGAPGAGAGSATVVGVELRSLDPRESAELGLGAGEGLAVTAVDPRGPASGVLEEGDILLALDGRGITLARFKAVVARLQRGAHATLVIQRGPDRFALRL
ncbi:MAG TPA: trypsin-like peptidase domain-containing protein [Polyangia bacterium]|jgi:Do/DeqQ family serine protease|nr:trypsin-like peptidase domain-containing protein [Polyangia bacterium]